MVFLCKKTLVDLLSIRHFSEEVAFQTMEWPWDVLVFPWFTQTFTKLTEVSNHCNAPAAGLPFWCCCGLTMLQNLRPLLLRLGRDKNLPRKCTQLETWKAAQTMRVLDFTCPKWPWETSKRGSKLDAQRFAQISALVPDTVQPVRVGGLTPGGRRMTYLYSSLFELEDACDLAECELRHSAGKSWIDVYMIRHKKEQQLWDGLCILCLSIYFRFLQYVFITPWHEKIPTYPNHQPPLEGPHRRCQFSSTGANSTASALLPDAPGMKWLGENAPMFGHSTHRETDAQPIKVGDVPFNFQTAPVVPTKFAKRLPTDGDVWIILEWSFRQDPGNLCVFWWNNGHGWTEAPRQLAEP